MKWAVILAGGNGSRLQTLTRALTGDDRPKQFCPLFAGTTLLAQTRARLGRSVSRSHTLCVVTRGHESYYGPELLDLPPAHVVEQPGNRGTAAAIAYSIMRVRKEDRKAVIGFYPADHYYEDAEAFTHALDTTYAIAAARPDTVFLLGTEPQSAEVEYGWIEPGRSLDMPGARAFAVREFWEKPSRAKAAELFVNGCLWNIFVMIGTAGAFRSLLRAAIPEVMFAFDLARYVPESTENAIDRVYSALTPCDFSHDVLARHPDKVAVVKLPNVGWIDLGQPARVQSFLGTQRRQAQAVAS
jgi:mannose-1-phosphate guanylyltransferase